ncbi:MAG: PLP-dependent aminotransferase family protein [Oscillatoria sp. PMC 1051.18]|nr:PLP-dependent aminotransferase family protein [Oscillatoria sp. PMC 1050.18]MEC5030817.1 PLP-dependent aminotransferase family protein [Oscillatoria sp. PMC 1051.18]
MRIPLDRCATKPVYLQIRDRLHRLIESGALKPGDRLPSIRSLANSTQVNKLTVIEAYGVLEADGLIHARPGAGYFVNSETATSPKRESNFAPKQDAIVTKQRNSSFIAQYQASTRAVCHPAEIIDLSGGLPIKSDLDDLQRIARRAMKQVSDTLFNYGLTQGQCRLREQIAQMLVQQGLAVSPGNLIITNGSAQGLSLIFRYYVKPGDWVIVESPGYHGALAILEDIGARIIGIPITGEGMNLEFLEQYLRSHRPKLIYTVSTLQNPTGLTTSTSHRRKLLALAEEYECLILEDNAYEGLSFEPPPAPIKALDREDTVIYVGTFSKTLMPGLRVGYMVATGQNYANLLEQKLLHDLHVSTVSQAIVSEYLGSGHYRRHLKRLQASNLQNRNQMLAALERYFPNEATWTVPEGGIFLWVQLPERLPLLDVYREALAQNVLVSPGNSFFPGQGGYNAMRINFSHSPEVIERGISILGKLLKDKLSQAG